MSDKDQLLAASEPEPEKSIRVTMRMARADEKDMDAGYAIMSILGAIDKDEYPSSEEDSPYWFDSDDLEHLQFLHRSLKKAMDEAPGCFGRIMGGLSIFLNPKNDIVDFTDSCIELSPRLKEAIKAKEELDKLKAENDRLRGLLAEKVVNSTMLTGLEINRGGVDIGFEGGAARMLAEMFIEQFNASGAINSLEVTFQDKELGQIVVTTQRMGGLTPSQQREKAIAERDTLLIPLVKIVTETMDYPPVPPTSADSWLPRDMVAEAQAAITAVRGHPVPTYKEPTP